MASRSIGPNQLSSKSVATRLCKTRLLRIAITRSLPSIRYFGLEADLRQRSAKPSLGWPECRLSTSQDEWLALAAKVRFPPLVSSYGNGPNVCTGCCSQMISGMFSEVAHMYPAC
jgi:hypothetical protein